MNLQTKVKFIPVRGDDFVGIKYQGEKILFYYSEEYFPIENIEFHKEQIIKYLRTLRLAVNEQETNENIGNNVSINSMLWIISDYISHGIPIEFETITKNSLKGKINWKKTMDQVPIINGNNLSYVKFFSLIKNPIENELIQLYKYCLKISIDIIGWIFNLKYYVEMKFEKKYAINIIDQTIQNTFRDQKRLQLHHMKQIIQGSDDILISSSEITYGLNSYHHVFEEMLRKTISNVDEKLFYPRGYWMIDNNKIPSSKLRPDIVYEESDEIYIIDAKFYHFGVSNDYKDLPASSDIQKQVYYAEHVKYIDQNKRKIFNSFILPYRNVQPITTFGSSRLENQKEESYEKIVGVFIDLEYLINRYFMSQNIDINLLKEKIKSEFN